MIFDHMVREPDPVLVPRHLQWWFLLWCYGLSCSMVRTRHSILTIVHAYRRSLRSNKVATVRCTDLTLFSMVGFHATAASAHRCYTGNIHILVRLTQHRCRQCSCHYAYRPCQFSRVLNYDTSSWSRISISISPYTSFTSISKHPHTDFVSMLKYPYVSLVSISMYSRLGCIPTVFHFYSSFVPIISNLILGQIWLSNKV